MGELVGARLIAHSGSLINLAKQPASTVQILGAEKALFRALKSKTDTPKYGLIYHASLIGQSAPKNKGKISRVLAAKTALSIRVDALGENDGPTIAIESKIKVEARIRQLEGGQKVTSANGAGGGGGPAKYDATAAKALAPPKFSAASDMQLEEANGSEKKAKKDKKDKKRSREEEVEVVAEVVEEDKGEKKKKKDKKEKKEKKEETVEVEEEVVEEAPKKKKKKKDKN